MTRKPRRVCTEHRRAARRARRSCARPHAGARRRRTARHRFDIGQRFCFLEKTLRDLGIVDVILRVLVDVLASEPRKKQFICRVGVIRRFRADRARTGQRQRAEFGPAAFRKIGRVEIACAHEHEAVDRGDEENRSRFQDDRETVDERHALHDRDDRKIELEPALAGLETRPAVSSGPSTTSTPTSSSTSISAPTAWKYGGGYQTPNSSAPTTRPSAMLSERWMDAAFQRDIDRIRK